MRERLTNLLLYAYLGVRGVHCKTNVVNEEWER